jgi:hypothetical protein
MATKKRTFIDANGNIVTTLSDNSDPPAAKKQNIHGPPSTPASQPQKNYHYDRLTPIPKRTPSSYVQSSTFGFTDPDPPKNIFSTFAPSQKSIRIDMELLKNRPLRAWMQFGAGKRDANGPSNSVEEIEWGIKTSCTLEYVEGDVIRVKEGNIKDFKLWNSKKRCYHSVNPGFFIRVFSVC